MYTLGQAAKASGKAKGTISKALKSGKISGTKDENGVFRIDPAELHRVYPAVSQDEQNEQSETPEKQDNILVKELELRLEAAEQRITDKDQLIGDLREDRDRWRQQATALLEAPTEKRRRWWPWKRA